MASEDKNSVLSKRPTRLPLRTEILFLLLLLSIFLNSVWDFSEITAASTESNASPVTQSHRDHPHMGARDASGGLGYVADVTRVRRWMLERSKQANSTLGDVMSHTPRRWRWTLKWSQQATNTADAMSYLPMEEQERQKVCGSPFGVRSYPHSRQAWNLLVERVIVDGPDPSPYNSSFPQIAQRTPFTGKILCAVYTYDKRHTSVQGIAETWGWRCDGFLAASNQTVEDPSEEGFGAVDLPHEGREEYRNMWQKTRSILGYLHDNYLNDYDYFYISGDDTHLIVENLRNYLSIIEQQGYKNRAVYTGHLIPEPRFPNPDFIYCGGGPGYVLNRLALKRMVREALPVCHVHEKTSVEDWRVAQCLSSIGIHPVDSADGEGRQRFHGDANYIALYKPRNGTFFKKAYDMWGASHGLKIGKELISSQSVAFHGLNTKDNMKLHHAILYRNCPLGTAVGDTLALHDRK